MNRVFRFPRRVLGALSPIVARPPVRQVAALCLRTGRKGPEVLMITSRGSGRWIIPKGWPMEGKTAGEAALQEAWEEAGVRAGTVGSEPLGSFAYRKILDSGLRQACAVDVYAVEVQGLSSRYPEADARKRRWMRPEKAAMLVHEKGLRAILRTL